MKKIISIVFKSKFNPTLFKNTQFSKFSRSLNYFSTNKENEDVKVDPEESHEDFKPKIKPSPEKNYESLYPEIEKVFTLLFSLFILIFFRL